MTPPIFCDDCRRPMGPDPDDDEWLICPTCGNRRALAGRAAIEASRKLLEARRSIAEISATAPPAAPDVDWVDSLGTHYTIRAHGHLDGALQLELASNDVDHDGNPFAADHWRCNLTPPAAEGLADFLNHWLGRP